MYQFVMVALYEVCICVEFVEFAEICCCVTVSGCVSMLVLWLLLGLCVCCR